MTNSTFTTPTKQSTKTQVPKLTPVSTPKMKPCSLADVEHSKPPPVPICEDINNRIRLNPMHGYPHFDFASYVHHRSYTLCTIDFGTTTSACFLDDGVHDIIADLLPQIPLSPIPASSFEIRDARGKGLGMFSTVSVPTNSTILTEHPTIITPYLLGVSVPLSEMYTELFESLPKPSFALSTSLATSSQDDDDDIDIKLGSQSHLPKPSFYEDIMQTNALAIDLHVPLDVPFPELTTHRALFLLASRCNHSCNPNASWSWDSSMLTLTLTALRSISPGEEITISYIPLSESHSIRQETLREVYGFECCCEACSLPSYELVKTDGMTITLEERDDEELQCDEDNDAPLPTFEEWCSDPTLPDDILINAHKQALHLIEQQGLESLKSTRLGVPQITQGPFKDEDDENETEKDWQLQIMDANIGLMPAGSDAEAIDRHVDAIAMCYGALRDATNFRNWVAIIGFFPSITSANFPLATSSCCTLS